MRAFAFALLAACAGATPSTPATQPTRPAAPSEPAGIPPGYVDARVLQVVALGEGGAVLLLDESTMSVLPIFIGGTEAMSIDLRMRGEPPKRPLTHDLLDMIMRKLEGRLVKVQVDELRDGTYHGSVYVRTQGRIIRVDARPSDALALAIGNKVPIYVAKKVMDEAGISKDEVMRQLQPTPGSATTPTT